MICYSFVVGALFTFINLHVCSPFSLIYLLLIVWSFMILKHSLIASVLNKMICFIAGPCMPFHDLMKKKKQTYYTIS